MLIFKQRVRNNDHEVFESWYMQLFNSSVGIINFIASDIDKTKYIIIDLLFDSRTLQLHSTSTIKRIHFHSSHEKYWNITNISKHVYFCIVQFGRFLMEFESDRLIVIMSNAFVTELVGHHIVSVFLHSCCVVVHCH